MTHRYAEVMGWLAEGKPVLSRFNGGEEALFPNDFTTASAASFLMGSEGWEFRLKPHTVKIGSREVEAPVLEPVEGQTYWGNFGEFDHPESVVYKSGMSDWAKKGEYYASQEAASAVKDAIRTLILEQIK